MSFQTGNQENSHTNERIGAEAYPLIFFYVRDCNIIYYSIHKLRKDTRDFNREMNCAIILLTVRRSVKTDKTLNGLRAV